MHREREREKQVMPSSRGPRIRAIDLRALKAPDDRRLRDAPCISWHALEKRLKMEAAARVAAERHVKALERQARTAREEAQRRVNVLETRVEGLTAELESHRSARRSAADDRTLLRRLLLAFHPDKSGNDAVFTSTSVTQVINEVSQECRD